MRFQVPQFIDVEDKVFGPFTFKQFVYLGGGVGICFVLLRIIPTKWIAIPAIIVVVVISASLAFYRVNNKPFIQLVEAAFMYLVGSRLYIWKHKERQAQQKPLLAENYMRMQIPKMEGSRLKELSWSLDARKGENNEA